MCTRSQKGGSDFLELELQIAISCHVGTGKCTQTLVPFAAEPSLQLLSLRKVETWCLIIYNNTGVQTLICKLQSPWAPGSSGIFIPQWTSESTKLLLKADHRAHPRVPEGIRLQWGFPGDTDGARLKSILPTVSYVILGPSSLSV